MGGLALNIIMSGAHAINLPRPLKTEAETMRDYAIKKGVPRSVIIPEMESRSTIENALFTKRITEALGWRKILIVTSDYHLNRSLGNFQDEMGPDYEIDGVPVEYALVQPNVISLQAGEIAVANFQAAA